jgi:hypothetical protein
MYLESRIFGSIFCHEQRRVERLEPADQQKAVDPLLRHGRGHALELAGGLESI